jgi:hypothetical protein
MGEVTHHFSSAFAERSIGSCRGPHVGFNGVADCRERQSHELIPGLFDSVRNWQYRF